jgi:BirA family biotin operon repressor/biotin-[acetyl-CoA-carboxylase] ligase
VATADSLAPERLEPLLAGRFGRPYLYEEECESTQALLEPGLPEGAAAVCEHQTGGRGRRGRTWTAPPRTAILCSVLLRPPRERAVQELSLVAGLATAEAVERALTLSAQLKWPNDVMVNRRKVAGVLAEGTPEAVVVGIGVNVNQTPDQLPPATQLPATSIRIECSEPLDRAELLVAILDVLEQRYDEWLSAGT